MFADLLKRLTQPGPAPLPDEDARLALSALLVRVARADGHFDGTERTLILQILEARFGLDAAAAADLLHQAQILESEAPDTVRFTRAIKDAVPFEDRTAILESLWQVVLADGVRDDAEDSLLRMVSNFLGINDRDSALARQRVEARS
ncbi:TerB family tellurite resistance protein [Thalassovita sp.]|jgi:uncharacterized tellurite resistance protein B-like protein|uniref:tellurite resistance TerB family protein n=1 Tax=Thalassovita sp. TaxID=1979401 RepID=UPI003B5AF997